MYLLRFHAPPENGMEVRIAAKFASQPWEQCFLPVEALAVLTYTV